MLVGKRVILRTVREADLEGMHDLNANIGDMGDYWPFQMRSELRSNKHFMETGWWEEDFGVLLIADLENNILGHINFFKAAVYQNAYDMGYRIYQPENWGKGYMTEAVSLTVSFLFETKTVDRIQATAMPANEGSKRVLERCGFQHEGTMRKALFHRGRSEDIELYSVLRDAARPLKELLG